MSESKQEIHSVVLKHGLLSFSVQPHLLHPLLDFLAERVRHFSRYIEDSQTSHELVRAAYGMMARMARMSYELVSEGSLRDLSCEDIMCLTQAPHDLESLHKVLNSHRGRVRLSGVDDILEGHRCAKSIQSILEC